MLVLGIVCSRSRHTMCLTEWTSEVCFPDGSARIRNKWDYDVAGRIGVAFDRALAYGKRSEERRVGEGCSTRASPCSYITNQGSATLDGLLSGGCPENAFPKSWAPRYECDHQ